MLLHCFTFVNRDYHADLPMADCSKGSGGTTINCLINFSCVYIVSEEFRGQAVKLSCLSFQGCQSEVNDLHIKFFLWKYIYIYIY